MGFTKERIDMTEEELEIKIRELIKKMANIPINQKDRLISTLKETKKDTRNITNKLADTLTNLRIVIKYMVFDLEATSRERDNLKALLEKHRPDDDDSPNQAEGEM